MNTTITKDQAIQILIKAAQMAQSKGAFSLEEAAVITGAVSVASAQPQPEQLSAPVEVQPQPEVQAEPTPEVQA